MAPGTVWCVLPGGVQVSASPRVASAEGLERRPESDARQVEEVRLAVFCPDGSAIPEGARYLSDEGVDLAITIHAWVGGASFAPYVPPVEDGPRAEAGDSP